MDRIQREPYVRPGADRLEHQKVANHSQNVASSFSRGNQRFHSVSEQQQSYPVVVGGGREGHDRGKLYGQLPLEPVPGAEVPGPAHVDRQHDRQFPFFDVTLYVRLAGAGSHVPVDGAHIVAGVILTDLVEFHAPALEH